MRESRRTAPLNALAGTSKPNKARGWRMPRNSTRPRLPRPNPRLGPGDPFVIVARRMESPHRPRPSGYFAYNFIKITRRFAARPTWLRVTDRLWEVSDLSGHAGSRRAGVRRSGVKGLGL
jgi:hypothetical protein